jgi:eukaryotic-like serine/threonine-protein kinase
MERLAARSRLALLSSGAMGGFVGTAQYEIRRLVGEGAMGIVYEAYDREREAVVAVKRLRHADARSLYHFKREFRALADLHHPNLVVLHELSTAADDWLLSMEYIDGVDFVTWMQTGGEPRSAPRHDAYADTMMGEAAAAAPGAAADRERADAPLSRAGLRRLRSALRQLCEGVAALHAAGKLHRDIKPTNALVARDGRVVLLDFGLVADLGPGVPGAGLDAGIVGTPGYMAPEQCSGRPASPAQDWYAVGVVLYEALAGRLPFSGTPIEMMVDKQRFDPPAPAELVAGVPDDLNQLCVELLRRDPAQRPSVREVLRRVGGAMPDRWAADSFVSHRGSTPAIVVGRTDELQALGDGFAEAIAGRASAVYVRGPSGMGKTALIDCFLDALARQGSAEILRGRCYERESVPYKAVDSVIDALAQTLARLPIGEAAAVVPADAAALVRLFPGLRRVEALAAAAVEPPASDPQMLRQSGFAALRALLRALARRRPLVIHIDDLHWSDDDSAALLADVLGGRDAPPVFLIASMHGDAASAPPPPGLPAREVEVGPLAPKDARALALALLGRDDAEARQLGDAIAAESGGSPMFIGELVRQVVEAPAQAAGDGALHLDAVLAARIARLPAPARALLEAVAVAGRPTARRVLRRAAGLSADDDTAIAALRGGRLIRTRGGRDSDDVEVYHDRIRVAVAATLASDALVELHRRLAMALQTTDGDPELLAFHFRGAGEPGRAVEHAVAAARRAEDALAFDRAARLYRMTLELRAEAGEPAGAAERPLRVQLAQALAWSGRSAEAAVEYTLAQQGAPLGEALELKRRTAEELLRCGRLDEAVRALGEVLALVGLKLPPTPRRALPSLLVGRARIRLRGTGFRSRDERDVSPAVLQRIDTCWSVANGLGLVDTIRGADFQARHMLLALDAGEPCRIARALAAEAAYAAATGAPGRRRARALVARAQQLSAGLDDPLTAALVGFVDALTDFFAGSWRRALDRFGAVEAAFARHGRGVHWEINATRGFQSWSMVYLGELREVARRVEAAHKDARDRGDRYALASLCAGLPNLGWLVSDDPGRARGVVGEAMTLWSREGFHLQHYYELLALAHVDLYEGEPGRAWHRMSARWGALSRSLLLRVQTIRTELRFCRARVALASWRSDPQRRLAAVEADAAQLEREALDRAVGFAALARAGAAEARGDRDRAAALYRRAAAGFDADAMRLHAACARRRLGALIGGDLGHELVHAAEVWLASEGVRDPARLARVITPEV